MKFGIMSVMLMTALFASAPHALAQDQTGREALATRFIELARLDQIIEQMKGGLAAGMQASMQQAIQDGRIDASGDKVQQISAIVEEELKASLDALLPAAEEIMTGFYAERMTEAELSELIAIYERPVFDKMYELAPELNQEMLAVAIEQQQDSERRMMKRIEELAE